MVREGNICANGKEMKTGCIVMCFALSGMLNGKLQVYALSVA
jgi:hypothetical protein